MPSFVAFKAKHPRGRYSTLEGVWDCRTPTIVPEVGRGLYFAPVSFLGLLQRA